MIILLSLLQAVPANAGPEKQKRSGSSSAFVTCVQAAVLGRTDEECALQPEAEACVGLRRALENSQKKSECLRELAGGRCEKWAHNGLTEANWIAVASGHLGNFGVCVRKRYGDDLHSGLPEALADQSLLAFLKKLDDGGQVFRLSGSALLIGALQEKRFSDMIADSPFARERSPDDLYALKVAADSRPNLAPPEGEAQAGSNPASEGEDFREEARSFLADNEEIARSLTIGAPAPSGKPVTMAPLPERRLSSAAPEPAPSVSAPRSRRYTLGLDRSLFERVRDTYHRRASGLQSMEQILKRYPASPPRDYSDLLRRGGTL